MTHGTERIALVTSGVHLGGVQVIASLVHDPEPTPERFSSSQSETVLQHELPLPPLQVLAATVLFSVRMNLADGGVLHEWIPVAPSPQLSYFPKHNVPKVLQH